MSYYTIFLLHYCKIFQILGSIYYINSSGSCVEVLSTEGVPLSCLLYHQTKDALIVLMDGLTIGYFTVNFQGHLLEQAKVKLSGRMQSRNFGTQGIVWAGNSSLAILTGKQFHVVFDLT